MSGIAVGELMERRRVIGVDEVRQLVDEDGIKYPAGHVPKSIRETDGARRNRA